MNFDGLLRFMFFFKCKIVWFQTANLLATLTYFFFYFYLIKQCPQRIWCKISSEKKNLKIKTNAPKTINDTFETKPYVYSIVEMSNEKKLRNI